MAVKENSFQLLSDKIKNKEAVVGVMGLGYVGLPLAVLFAQKGFSVIGFDPDDSKRQKLEKGESYIQDVPTAQLMPLVPTNKNAVERGKISVSEGFGKLEKCDAIIVCVPTPPAKSKEPDLSYIVTAMEMLREFLRPGQLVVLESTTYPGTTRELVLPMLSEGNEQLSAYEVGKDFFLAFSPERVDPGNPKWHTENTPKVVGGITPNCSKLAAALYGNIVEKTVPVSSTDAAELTKLLENTFRLINIGLVNELSIICNRLGVDVWEVIDAAATKPFGFMPFYPGPGLGGHCIPIDPHYLSWKLRSLDYRAQFIDVASEINRQMPHVVVERVVEALNSHKKSINGAKIGILGVSYKKDIDDLRESPALDVIGLLSKRGAEISFHDPFVPVLEDHDGESMPSMPLSVGWLNQLDCAVVITDHAVFDVHMIVKNSKLIVDSRNLIARNGLAEAAQGKLFKL